MTMECFICHGRLRSRTVAYSEFGRSLGRFAALRCERCGEAYFDADEAQRIQSASAASGLFGISRKARVMQRGADIAILVPKEIASYVNLAPGKPIKIVCPDRGYLAIQV